MSMTPARPDPGKIRIEITQYCRRTGLYMKTANGVLLPEPNLTKLVRATGCAYTTIIPLLRDPHRRVALSLDTLARMCDALKCQPGDILRYEPYRQGTLHKRPEMKDLETALGMS